MNSKKATKFLLGKVTNYFWVIPAITILIIGWEKVKHFFAPKASSFDLGSYDPIIVNLIFAVCLFLSFVGFIRINFPKSLYKYFVHNDDIEEDDGCNTGIADDFFKITSWQRLKLFFGVLLVSFFLLIYLLSLVMGASKSVESLLNSLGAK